MENSGNLQIKSQELNAMSQVWILRFRFTLSLHYTYSKNTYTKHILY